MKQNEISVPAKYISSLHINGLRGRSLGIPSKNRNNSKNNILLLYGHHSSIERMFSLASYLSSYGNVKMPDLPGFGGMDSMYIIRKKPDLDSMADYVATYIKLTYKRQPVAICGMSYGFLVVTRMLQKYPELADQVTLLVSLVGFSHYKDFSFRPTTYRALLTLAYIFKHYFPAVFAKYILLSKPMITLAYTLSARSHVKMKDATKLERRSRIRFETYLWRCNDVRTYFSTMYDFLKVDITTVKVNLPLSHVTVNDDQYFNSEKVTMHLRCIYRTVRTYKAKLPNHAPTVISDEREASEMIPNALKRRLSALGAIKV